MDLAECFGGGQMTVGEGEIIPKESILSEQRHRHSFRGLF